MHGMKKRIFAAAAVCMLAVLTFPTVPDMVQSAVTAHAAESGTCGENLMWTLDEEGTLTISGTGEMENYRNDQTPFCDKAKIKKVVIQPGVTTIGEFAFFDCNSLTSVVLPESVTDIGDYAFYYCEKLPSITIPRGVTRIGFGTFYGCTALTEANIPDSVTSIETYAFKSCTSLKSITIPDGVTSIVYSTFLNCTALTSVIIPDSVTCIDYSAFENCSSLESVTIPNNATMIGFAAFRGCKSLTSLNIPDSVTMIDDDAFSFCDNLTSIEVSSNNPNYTSENGVLYSRDMKTLVAYPGGKQGTFAVPNGVTAFGEAAFAGCTALTAVTIPDSVERIGERVFCDCENLTSVTILNPTCEITDRAFNTFNGSDAFFTFTIYGCEGSTAQSYAEKYGHIFVVISAESSTTYSVADIIALTKFIHGTGKLSVPQAADLNHDGEVDVFDLALMKRAVLLKQQKP